MEEKKNYREGETAAKIRERGEKMRKN